MSKSLYQVRSYNVRHSYNIREFLEAYRLMLQNAIDEIWANIRWVERFNKHRKRIIPIIPNENRFKHHYLRNMLLGSWSYSKHYVDSAIKQAYSILKSWRRNYLRGERGREKPTVKKRFVRIKETLYSFRDGKIRISIKPYEEYLTFDISKAWFLSRAKGEMGELILGEKLLTVTFRFRWRLEGNKDNIAWDCNEKSLDGFNPKHGWIRIDLSQLFHIHRVYELKRKRLQSLVSKKAGLKNVLEKYSRRERNRAKDYIHKLTTRISKMFKGYVHGFENIHKNRMMDRNRDHNRRIAKSNWKMIQSLMAYKSRIIILDPRNTTRRCSRCGMVNAPKGASYACKSCGLRIYRQLNAAINLYLQMEGLSPSPKLFKELMKGWSGFTLTGEEADERPYEPMRASRLMSPKSYMSIKDHITQNPEFYLHATVQNLFVGY